MDLLPNVATSPAANRRPASNQFLKLRQHLELLLSILGPKQTARRRSHASLVTPLIQTICLLARDARAVGLTTFCSLSLHVLEQLAPAKRASYVPAGLQALIHEWATLSRSFLLDPSNPTHVAELIAHMGNCRWERPVCRIQRQWLLENLRMEALRLTAPGTETRARISGQHGS